jgi:YegS/Rv2252/BmrU family lipid kinase
MNSTAQKVRIIINPKSGLGASMGNLMQTFTEFWDCDGREITYQLTKSAEDGRAKARRAIEEGVDSLIVVGGDGVINSIGAELLDSPVSLGVIPTGSGNGFARHFGINLSPGKAIRQLVHAKPEAIDVGLANGRPFFVTCSMAWDAALVKTFEKSPVRGILPYVFAAAYELFDYKSERFHVRIDDEPEAVYDHPMLFTVANLTQFGGGARIAPNAKADDGFLWLTAAFRDDVPRLIPNLYKLFDGSLGDVPEVKITPLREMRVRRETGQPIQLDGELVDSPPEVHIQLRPKALNVLVPPPAEKE